MRQNVPDSDGPQRAIIYATRKCNMRCEHCWVGSGPDESSSLLSKCDPRELSDALMGLGVRSMTITGGEPLLEGQFTRSLIREGCERGLRMSLETNGTLLTTGDLELFHALNVDIAVSLDSIVPGMFDIFRRFKGAYEAAVRAIASAVDSGLTVQVIMSVLGRNASEMPGLVHLALDELRAHNVKINIITPLNRGKTLLSSPDEYVSVIETLKTMLRGLGSQYWRRLSTNVPLALIDYLVPPATCDFRNVISVLPDLSVSFCGVGMNYPELRSEGSLRGLRSIWTEAPVFRQLRAIAPGSVEGVCTICVFGEVCCNACPATVYGYYGSLYKSHPWCEAYYKAGLFPTKFLRSVAS